MQASYSIGPDIIISITQAIGRCDFRTTVSLYTTGSDLSRFPWIITVSESNWQRHIIVESAMVGTIGCEANLAVLATSESEKFGYDIRTDRIETRLTLSELITDRYIGVKKVLCPPHTNMTRRS